MTAPRYAYSHNGEEYHGDFATREEAVVEADGEPGDTVYTGEVRPYMATIFIPCASYIIENMQEAACDEAGDITEGWLEDVKPAAVTDLKRRLDECIDKWLTDHGHQPHFWSVDNVETHSVPPRTAPDAE